MGRLLPAFRVCITGLGMGPSVFEIAELIYNIFYETTDYITNTVIKVDGGKFSRM